LIPILETWAIYNASLHLEFVVMHTYYTLCIEMLYPTDTDIVFHIGGHFFGHAIQLNS